MRIALLALAASPAWAQIAVEDFSAGMSRWWSEGGERIWVQDGHLHMKAESPAAPGGDAATAWWTETLPEDFVLTLEAHVVTSPKQANNINLFLCYSDPSGRPLMETRAGRASADCNLYHRLNGYINTFPQRIRPLRMAP